MTSPLRCLPPVFPAAGLAGREKRSKFAQFKKSTDMNEELLKQCRWYKGEKSWKDSTLRNSPKIPARSHIFWEAEKTWVEMNGHAYRDSLICLVGCGLSTEDLIKKSAPPEITNIPLSLRALIFAEMNHYLDGDPVEIAQYFVPFLQDYIFGHTGSTSI